MRGKTTKNKMTKKRKLIILGCVFIVLVAVCIIAFYNGLVVRNYEIKSNKSHEGSSVRIVVIADLHSIYYGENQQDIIDKIKEQDPDIIALVGDIIDDNIREDGAIAFLEGIQGIAPAYYVIGNHEVWTGEVDRIKEMVASYDIKVLTNESDYIVVNGVDFCISGIDDPVIFGEYFENGELILKTDDKLLSGFSNLDNSVYNILLAHRPERFKSYQKYDFDLVLSGHAHGGQVRIPFILNGLIAPNQGVFPKYAGGEYFENGQTMIVSRGLGKYKTVPRVFNPPEIVVIDIVKEG